MEILESRTKELAILHVIGRVNSSNAFELDERLTTVIAAAKEMIQPTVFGQAIIILVYVPLLTFSGVEGKMFHPMAFAVIAAVVFGTLSHHPF